PNDKQLPLLYARARALLVGAEEDFGMTLVEAIAAGRPVVAYAGGGAKEIVQDGINGILFHSQETEAMEAAVLRTESAAWDREQIRATAARFSVASFQREYLSIIDAALRERGLPARP